MPHWVAKTSAAFALFVTIGNPRYTRNNQRIGGREVIGGCQMVLGGRVRFHDGRG